MIKHVKVRLHCSHKTEAKAKEHAAFVKSKNENKVLATGYEFDEKLGHRSWFEMMGWKGEEDED